MYSAVAFLSLVAALLRNGDGEASLSDGFLLLVAGAVIILAIAWLTAHEDR